MDIVMVRGTEEKTFWCFEDGSFRDITNGMGSTYTASEFRELYNNLIQGGWKEQDYRIAGNSFIGRNRT